MKNLNSKLLLLLLLAVTASCNNLTEVDQAGSRGDNYGSFAGTGRALVYTDNPNILRGKSYLSSAGFENVSLTSAFITSNNYLQSTCDFSQSQTGGTDTVTTTESCFGVLNNELSSTEKLTPGSGGWAFAIDSDEFYQVNAFYHVDLIKKRFFDALSFSHDHVHFKSNMTIPPASKFNLTDTKSFWLNEDGATKSLSVYSNYTSFNYNAFFSPASNELGFGLNDGAYRQGFRTIQDPTVVYHEMGHLFVKIMLNQRNTTNVSGTTTSHPYQADLGSIFYDEAGGINEGIADFFAYVMTQRKVIGEWALQGAARPMEETNSIHTAAVSKSSGERLSYPNFVQYDYTDSSKNVEDVHAAGLITTHYLVELTETFKSQCSVPHTTATNYTTLLINETLAEIGDLTGKGSDLLDENHATGLDFVSTIGLNYFFTNLNSDASFEWTSVVNPPNQRRFFRIFGKNILHYISNDLCPSYTQDKLETLLDEYGLLLFKSYEDLGSGYDSDQDLETPYWYHNNTYVFLGRALGATPSALSTLVNEDNRKHSVLISKDFITQDETTLGFIIDKQKSIENILAHLTFEGKNVVTSQGLAGTEYNNSNVQISPGEIVGLTPNIFNNSNSVMAGVQILANDWDHMKLNNPLNTYVNRLINSGDAIVGSKIASHSLCTFDGFPSTNNGGVTDTATGTQGSCAYVTKTNKVLDLSTVNPEFDPDAPQPVCTVQYRSDDKTLWVPQDFYRQEVLDLDDNLCLNNPAMSGNDFNGNECLIRFLPGAQQSILSKINAQSTWHETLKGSTDTEVKFQASNLLLMEVNKWIPPGTSFTCRLRTRISNCQDCFTSNGTTEYKDNEYAGADPFKIINFQFKVEN